MTAPRKRVDRGEWHSAGIPDEYLRKATAYDRLVRALEIVESGKVLPLATDEIRRILEAK